MRSIKDLKSGIGEYVNGIGDINGPFDILLRCKFSTAVTTITCSEAARRVSPSGVMQLQKYISGASVRIDRDLVTPDLDDKRAIYL